MSDAPAPHTREASGLSLDRQVRWWHDGERVEHPRIIEAFNQGLRVTPEGRYRLELGQDWCFVTVADCAFTVVAVDVSEGARLSVRLSDRTAEWLDAATLAVDDEGVLTVKVKAGLARARFSREAQFQLAQHVQLEGDQVWLAVEGTRTATPLTPAAFVG
jgi:hypothetical protein